MPIDKLTKLIFNSAGTTYHHGEIAKGLKQKPCLKSMVKIKFKQLVNGQAEFLSGQDFDCSRRSTYSMYACDTPLLWALLLNVTNCMNVL